MTSSGLLDKAKAREDEIAETADAELVPEIESTSKEFNVSEQPTDGADDGWKNAPFTAGAALLVVSMVGFFFLKEVPGIVVLGIFIVSFGLAGHGMTGGLKINAGNRKKWISLGVAWLIFGGIPYIGGANTGGNISVSLDQNTPLDEAENTLNFFYYSSGGLFGSGVGDDPITVRIEHDGTVWTGEVPGDGDRGEFQLSIDDFYSGNAQYVSDIQEVENPHLGKYDAPVTSERPYILTVESARGAKSNQYEITSALMTRTIDDIDIEMVLFSETVTNDPEDPDDDEEYEGVILKGWFGHMASEFDGALRPNGVQSDYTVSSVVEVDNSIILEYPVITVDGTTATWDDTYFGDGVGKVGESASDFEYEGDAEGPNTGISYFTKDQIYDGDGCYTFTVTITNSAAYADQSPIVTESAYYEWSGGGTDDEALDPVGSC